MSTELDVRTGDPDLEEENRYSHIVDKNELPDAIINGTPIEALCGYTWVPGRDPQRYPICSRCEDLAKRGELDINKLS